MACVWEKCDNLNEEHSDFCKTHNRILREKQNEFDSDDKCVQCGSLRPLFKSHCQTESCKELRRQKRK